MSGYLGGEQTKAATLNIYQYDAHAWVEVFFDEKWHIFDATAVVVPERLNGSLSQLGDLNESFNDNLNFGLKRWSHFKAINWLRIHLEELDYKWTNWVLTFDQESQQSLFDSLFGNKSAWLTPLIVLGTLLLSFTGYFLYNKRPIRSREPLVGTSLSFTCGQKQGIEPVDTNTPLQNIALIKQQKPRSEAYLSEFEQIIIEVRYQQQSYNQNRKNRVRVLLNSLKTAK